MKLFRLLLLLISVCFPQERSDKIFLFISDTQQPLWIETFRLKEHNNEMATQKLFSAMAQESSVVALFHLGDITGMGMLDGYWKSFDTLRKMLEFPVYPVFGNHEYFFIPSKGKEQTLKRFPFLEPSWYVRHVGRIAIILLNSNFSRLSDDDIAAQELWYKDQLMTLETDSTVKAIIVGCHHSPYTNSSIVNSDEDVQQQFGIPFKKSVKAKVFISGHAHTYEHFRIDDKDFLVIGGGGLQHPLVDETERRWKDISSQQSKRKFFHYVRCEEKGNELVFQVMMFTEDLSELETVDRVVVPF